MNLQANITASNSMTDAGSIELPDDNVLPEDQTDAPNLTVRGSFGAPVKLEDSDLEEAADTSGLEEEDDESEEEDDDDIIELPRATRPLSERSYRKDKRNVDKPIQQSPEDDNIVRRFHFPSGGVHSKHWPLDEAL